MLLHQRQIDPRINSGKRSNLHFCSGNWGINLRSGEVMFSQLIFPNIDNQKNRFHPIYITDSNEGAYDRLTLEKRMNQQVFAGIAYDSAGYPYPTATGRYCEWTHRGTDMSAESETFDDYMKTLRLECDENGEPAYLNWTVPMDAPNVLYYQVKLVVTSIVLHYHLNFSVLCS